MNTWADVVKATLAKASKLVGQVQVLDRVVLVSQWYSSDKLPPGKRSACTDISCRPERVAVESKAESQIAVLIPNIRRSTVRITCDAFTVTVDVAVTLSV